LIAEPLAALVALQLIPATGIIHDALSEGERVLSFLTFLFWKGGQRWPGR
jgi:hypothetical protein